MGNTNSISFKSLNIYNFEKVQLYIKNSYIIINTLPESEQSCLIYGTMSIHDEITTLNELLKKDKNKNIIIYGKNSSDYSVLQKYNQLINLGFTNVGLYLGGIFEWLLLQDIYGNINFPTSIKEIDILKYK